MAPAEWAAEYRTMLRNTEKEETKWGGFTNWYLALRMEAGRRSVFLFSHNLARKLLLIFCSCQDGRLSEWTVY